MSLSVSYNQRFTNGVDVNALKEVTQKIFERANTKSTSELSNLDLTKFNRVNLGTDLYGNKVDAAAARKIASANAGLDVQLSANALNSLKYLSSEASKSIFKTVEGKIAIPEAKDVTLKQRSEGLPTFGKLTETADVGKDKNGSNPFYKGEILTSGNAKKEEKQEEMVSIFA